MQNLIITYFTVVFFVSLISCSKRENIKPVAEIISPLESDTLLLTDTLYFRAAYSDNEELNQYRLEIKNNFTAIADSLAPWKYIRVDALKGITDTISLELVIPDTIFNGSYFLITKCVDQEGNESPSDTVKIEIQ